LKVTVERTPESEAVLNVELEWSELEKASDRAYRKLVQKYNVPGFRRGHAPRATLERMLGKEALYQEGLDDLVDESVRSAVREHHLRPLSRPTVDTPPIEHGQPYTFTAHLPILAPVELGDYKSIRVEQPKVEVTEEEIQQIVDRVQREHARWLPVDRPARSGDHVTTDLTVKVGERTVSNQRDHEFELTSERFGIFSGMDPQIEGMEQDATKEFTTTIPEDYANIELAGKEAHFTVTVKAIKERDLPALDDELAMSVGNYDSFEAMRTAIRDQLLERKEADARREVREQVAKAVSEQAKVEIHPLLVDDEVHAMMREQERSLSRNRLTLQQYLEATNKTEEQYHTELEPAAKERVQRDLVLGAVAEAEDVDVTDQDMETWLRIISAVSGDKPLRLRQLSPDQRANVRGRLRRENALDRLVAIATGSTEEATTGETASERNAEAAATAAATLAPSEPPAASSAPDAARSTAPERADQPSANRSTAKKPSASAAGTHAEAVETPAPESQSTAAESTPTRQALNTEVPESPE
jgi:trigger factor